MAEALPLPLHVQAMVESFNNLIPGIPASEEVLNEILKRLPCSDNDLDSFCIALPGVGTAFLWRSKPLPERDPCQERKLYASASWEDDEICCWSANRNATRAGLFALLIELRGVYTRMLGGPCPNCAHEDDSRLPLVPGGKCARCTVAAFVTTTSSAHPKR